MSTNAASPRPRVLSGMRPTGMLHLGHYFLLEKWVEIQDDCDCHFFVADYHALTTAIDRHATVARNTRDMLVCWLAAGIDPDRSVLFVQSQLREHAELHVILSMVCPVPWLERVPHYKDFAQQTKPENINYGFLGYPLLQAADIIVHAADYVPVGDDQEAHVELAAQIARAFNDQFGKDANWQRKADELVRTGLADSAAFLKLCQRAHQDGDTQARVQAVAMIHTAPKLDREGRQRLLGWIDGRGRQLLVTPEVMKAAVTKLPGLDGRKMSKSENNDIGMLEAKDSYDRKIKSMPTDPARVRRTDPGNPAKCPVWPYHQIFSSAQECDQVQEGCTSAKIGCLDCKGILVENIEKVVAPLRERAQPWLADDQKIELIIKQGNERAHASATATMSEVRAMVGLPQA